MSIPSLKGRCEKIGRASLLASHRPSKSLPQEARREPRPPISAGFEFFHTFRGVGGCPCRKLEAPPTPSGRLPCLINDSSEDLRYSCPIAFRPLVYSFLCVLRVSAVDGLRGNRSPKVPCHGHFLKWLACWLVVACQLES